MPLFKSPLHNNVCMDINWEDYTCKPSLERTESVNCSPEWSGGGSGCSEVGWAEPSEAQPHGPLLSFTTETFAFRHTRLRGNDKFKGVGENPASLSKTDRWQAA